MADPLQEEPWEAPADLPATADDSPQCREAAGIEIICPDCKYRWNDPAQPCPQCGADAGLGYIATFRPPMPSAGRKLAWAGIVGLVLLVVLTIIALAYEQAKGGRAELPGMLPARMPVHPEVNQP
jgi:hypothetical protein